ncbi:MAG: hypothetical protein IJ773_03050 [Lachnospiraceae bacterium]|nr:hypothetical protein [Lachnospiraceae bacterium]
MRSRLRLGPVLRQNNENQHSHAENEKNSELRLGPVLRQNNENQHGHAENEENGELRQELVRRVKRRHFLWMRKNWFRSL